MDMVWLWLWLWVMDYYGSMYGLLGYGFKWVMDYGLHMCYVLWALGYGLWARSMSVGVCRWCRWCQWVMGQQVAHSVCIYLLKSRDYSLVGIYAE
ncbi:uncharacterized protein GGS25DRAFT_480929 [Hypoxylon fragiforme]|uniref:uncharacterized protein n=1 Tax=Hypoxylon fragiforme TaxID=63214 RepID=UPI0020C61901|nr:uncharacterized protein GGS25DRAFT_480929 [Hypoxylon fragiforme]KAI2610992.1 hypothetical protein GGS25DRAFT_480929 [Hypoxylon fragiforme]